MKAVACLAWTMLSLVGCSCGASDGSGGSAGSAGGTSGDGAPDVATLDAADAEGGSAGSAWDPVWHETAAKDWPKAPNASVPGCGQGCRVALDILSIVPANGHFTDSGLGLASVNVDLEARSVFYADFGSDDTWILDTGDMNAAPNGFTEPYLWGDLLSVLYVGPNSEGEVRIIQARTGETKVAYSYKKAAGDLGVAHTLINDQYVFWDRVGTGIMSRNLATGEVRLLVNFACEDLCAIPGGLVCFNSPNYFIDQETGAMTELAPGGALQIDGTCSHERDEIVWVDYRDPPGPGSDFWGYRSGGEVYAKHLVSGDLTRLTHDSPNDPRGKTYPAVGKELAVWKEVPVGEDPNPDSGQFLYAAADDLIVLDRKSGDRCRIHSDLVKYFTHMVVVGRWVYGSMGYVIGIDVDDPAIGCVKE